MVKVAVLGYGTVGTGVVEVIHANRELLKERIGQPIDVKYILVRREIPDCSVREKLTQDFEKILTDPEISIVTEVMGGIEPAFTYAKRCLEAGKSVVTSNKELVAKHGDELIALAQKRQVQFLFEGSVAGGIPVIRTLHGCLTGDAVTEIVGILNGTTNYMMTNMFQNGADYAEVLEEAQEHGYAERNPEADVEGYDACRKIAILTSLVSGKKADFEEIYCEGITRITTDDMKYAKQMGKTIKLLAIMKKEEDGTYQVKVAPFLLDAGHPLYSVDGVFNSVLIRGNMVGEVMLYGKGAGKLPTASAVVADLVEAARHPAKSVMPVWSGEKLSLQEAKKARHRFFLRLKMEGTTKDYLERMLGEGTEVTAGIPGETGFVTKEMTEEAFEKAIAEAEQEILSVIRVEESPAI